MNFLLEQGPNWKALVFKQHLHTLEKVKVEDDEEENSLQGRNYHHLFLLRKPLRPWALHSNKVKVHYGNGMREVIMVKLPRGGGSVSK